MQHFIRAFTVCQSTRSGVFSVQRVNFPFSVTQRPIHFNNKLSTTRTLITRTLITLSTCFKRSNNKHEHLNSEHFYERITNQFSRTCKLTVGTLYQTSLEKGIKCEVCRAFYLFFATCSFFIEFIERVEEKENPWLVDHFIPFSQRV